MHCLLLLLIVIVLHLIQAREHCSIFNSKLNKYSTNVNIQQQQQQTERYFTGLRLCQGLIEDQCCPQILEDRIQNATVTELYRLFELQTIAIYEPLVRSTADFNETIKQLLQLSRNETHLVLQRVYQTLYTSYRSSIDIFYNSLTSITLRTYRHDISFHIEQLFRTILRLSLSLNDPNRSPPSDYVSCVWQMRPFGTNANLLAHQLENNLGRLLEFNELLKLSSELVQIMSTSVTTDYHCIDSYMQLSYCNLCAGRRELPCLSNCANVIESCLVNVSIVNEVWRNFLDNIDNVAYFEGIEKVLSSVGLAISDAVMTFFNSGGVQNKDIIDQCGHLRTKRETFSIESTKFMNEQEKMKESVSILDKQLLHMSHSLRQHRSFWTMLPRQMCKSSGLSAPNGTLCWTGSILSQDGKYPVRPHYDKPLSLRLQWILKEMREKSQLIGMKRRFSSVLDPLPMSNLPPLNESKLKMIIQNLTDPLLNNDLDDYPNENEFDYSDYAYEDSTDETVQISSSTSISSIATRRSSIKTTTISNYDDLSADETNTNSYYDYGDHEGSDVYSDDDDNDGREESSTQKQQQPAWTVSSRRTTLSSDWKHRIPPYHRRLPVIWNLNNDDESKQQQQQRYNSGSSSRLNYSLHLLLIIFFVSRSSLT